MFGVTYLPPQWYFGLPGPSRIGFDAIHGVGRPDDRLRHIADTDPTRRDPLLATEMGVTVDRQICARLVDRLAEQVRTEKGVDLGRLAAQGLRDRRVVRERDQYVRCQRGQGGMQNAGPFRAVLDKVLHLALPERAPAPARAASAETFDSGDADLAAGDVQYHSFALQHRDAAAVEQLGDLVSGVAVVVVVAEYRQHPHAE